MCLSINNWGSVLANLAIWGQRLQKVPKEEWSGKTSCLWRDSRFSAHSRFSSHDFHLDKKVGSFRCRGVTKKRFSAANRQGTRPIEIWHVQPTYISSWQESWSFCCRGITRSSANPFVSTLLLVFPSFHSPYCLASCLSQGQYAKLLRIGGIGYTLAYWPSACLGGWVEFNHACCEESEPRRVSPGGWGRINHWMLFWSTND